MERLMKAIEDVPINTFDQVLNIHMALKEFKLNQSQQLLQNPDCDSIPSEIKLNKPPQLLQMSDSASIPKHFDQPTSMQSTMVDALSMSIKLVRILTQQTPSTSSLLMELPKDIYQMLPLHSKVYDHLQQDVQEDIIAMIKNIAVRDYHISNKILGESPDVIPLLIKALETGNTDTRTQAIKAIIALSANCFSTFKLSALGVMEALVHALECNTVAEKDVFEAIYKLCKFYDLRLRLLQVILDPIKGKNVVVRMLPFLEKLSGDQKGCNEMCKEGAVPCLLRIIRERGDPSNQEISVTILFKISFYMINFDKQVSTVRMIMEEGNSFHTISELARNGTQLGKVMAQNILDMLTFEPPTS